MQHVKIEVQNGGLIKIIVLAIKKTQLAFVGCENEYVRSVVPIKVVDIVPVLAGMYCTGFEMPTFRTSLNTGRTGYVPDVLVDFGCIGWY